MIPAPLKDAAAPLLEVALTCTLVYLSVRIGPAPSRGRGWRGGFLRRPQWTPPKLGRLDDSDPAGRPGGGTRLAGRDG